MRPTLITTISPPFLSSFTILLLCCQKLFCLLPKNTYKPNILVSTPNSHITSLPRRVSLVASAMDHCTLILCGKSSKEKGLASSLKGKKALKLKDQETGDDIDTKVLLDGETEVESFGVGSYMDALETQHFGRFLIWTPKITSTHDLLHQNFGDLPIGTACLADVQSKGRGRVSNVWESPAGCLMYSFTVQMHNGRILPLLQYVVSLAVTETVKHVCQEKLLLVGVIIGGSLASLVFSSSMSPLAICSSSKSEYQFMNVSFGSYPESFSMLRARRKLSGKWITGVGVAGEEQSSPEKDNIVGEAQGVW